MKCPDDGYCHHLCEAAEKPCFRVRFCAPLSGVFPDNEWPVDVLIAAGKLKTKAGTTITEAMMSELVAEAEAGYDVVENHRNVAHVAEEHVIDMGYMSLPAELQEAIERAEPDPG
jgi:hypothetical protein